MFPITLATPPRFAGPLPSEVDVAVIGGGIAGVMTAWFLNLSGLRVALCEKGRIAGEQSGRNWGWVRQQGRDPAELPMMIEANRIWRGLEAETGADLGFRQSGVLYAANTVRDLEGFEAWMTHARAHGLDTRLLTAAEVQGILPNAAGWLGGIRTASDCRAAPWKAVPALASTLAARGVAVREGCAVRALDREGGRVTGLVTEAGRVRADRVVLAGGAWSSLFLRRHGVGLPQLSVRATVTATAPLPAFFGCAAADNHFAIRRRQDGGYTLTPGGVPRIHFRPRRRPPPPRLYAPDTGRKPHRHSSSSRRAERLPGCLGHAPPLGGRRRNAVRADAHPGPGAEPGRDRAPAGPFRRRLPRRRAA